MTLSIAVHLDYELTRPMDILLQLEAAQIPEQQVESQSLDLSPCEHVASVAAQDGVGERIWVRAEDRLIVDYRATVAINRILTPCDTLDRVPLHQLPGETVQYLMPSRYCPADRFHDFVDGAFAGLEGGAMVVAMRDWIHDHLRYVPGSSNSDTTAADSFIMRKGVCRDYAHLLITFARAEGIPARIASVYALGVDPPDFHAVAEVFLGGEWHLVDPTGMAREADMVKIGVGRDAADVAFLTAFGEVKFNAQSVTVERA
ncbi:Transglutaminase-like enzyme, predicted cysteine protease [Sphingobium herbicidovorans NBRC 16415]|uniref:Transglutaminase-like enzyme, predicted cysteine protease n=1 Tax=Sphingobium herbicidovorans (strain ATCC 700291 / DSM 11019 / CCUG 56400 / KCTC 2939 / LMG 18315 / NBRC 16415 / MH) TaxID=1219045 RepID=A0A086P6A6_SPHHM|nr:transglutaminase family protein [Sphingobium herbicidovorans]KFG88924.1 Transglutaminase-like enzyme, predicted cysteine protease [Sphingobium herbicidovorans NBRC 16415]